MYKERDFVKLKNARINGSKELKIARVLKVNEHTLLIKPYDSKNHRFQTQSETIAIHMVEPAPEIEEAKMPCGKAVLNKNTALCLLATNEQFKDIKRREKRVYYCVRCKGYHTTSQPWMPISIKYKIGQHPLMSEDVMIKGDIICERTVFKWLRDTLGLRISHNWFVRSLKDYKGTMREALESILASPESYIEFFFEKRFVSSHALEIN